MISEMKRYFDTKYTIESRKEYSLATIVDPRYKSAGFRSKEKAILAKELLVQEILNRQTRVSDIGTEDSDDVQAVAPATPWEAILVDTEDFEEDPADERVICARRQVNDYMKEKRQPLKSDPLQYWAINKDRFNLISALVRKYLSAPPASTSVERLFSQAGYMLGNLRLSMKPENVECNVFLKYNLRALNAEKRNDLKIPPREFIPPNDKTNEIPKAASSRDFITDDEDDIEIVISSDEEFDDELLD